MIHQLCKKENKGNNYTIYDNNTELFNISKIEFTNFITKISKNNEWNILLLNDKLITDFICIKIDSSYHISENTSFIIKNNIMDSLINSTELDIRDTIYYIS